MKTLDVKINYRTYKECFLRVERYWHDGSISLTIWNQNDGCVARVTTCLVDHSLREDEAYVDANNCPWAASSRRKTINTSTKLLIDTLRNWKRLRSQTRTGQDSCTRCSCMSWITMSTGTPEILKIRWIAWV